MKTSIQTVGFFLLFFFWFLICPSSCSGDVAIDRRGYTRQDLDLRLAGTVNETKFEGRLSSRPNADGEDSRAIFIIESPASLRGLTVTLSANGDVSARLGDITESSDAVAPLADLFMPIIEMGEISSVKKGEGGSVTVAVKDEICDLEYVFAPDSRLPSQISGKYKDKTVNILILEQGEKEEQKIRTSP